jgi:hypothetical protein
MTASTTPIRCIGCKAEIIGGEPLHQMRVQIGSVVTFEYRCRECAEKLAEALWPEDYGPFPHQQHKAGRA